MTHYANFGFNQCSGGFSPNKRNVTTLWLFWLSCHVLFSRESAQVKPLNRFAALWLKRSDSAYGSAFWGLRRWVTSFGGDMPPKLPQNGRDLAISCQNGKIYKSQYLQNYKSGSRENLRIKLRPTIALRGWSNFTHIKCNMAAGRHLENKLIWRHNSVDYHLITAKFGLQMQNSMPVTIHKCKKNFVL